MYSVVTVYTVFLSTAQCTLQRYASVQLKFRYILQLQLYCTVQCNCTVQCRYTLQCTCTVQCRYTLQLQLYCTLQFSCTVQCRYTLQCSCTVLCSVAVLYSVDILCSVAVLYSQCRYTLQCSCTVQYRYTLQCSCTVQCRYTLQCSCTVQTQLLIAKCTLSWNTNLQYSAYSIATAYIMHCTVYNYTYCTSSLHERYNMYTIFKTWYIVQCTFLLPIVHTCCIYTTFVTVQCKVYTRNS